MIFFRKPVSTFRDHALKRESVAQVTTLGDDASDKAALTFGGKQVVDQIHLIHGDELQDFAAHFAGGG